MCFCRVFVLARIGTLILQLLLSLTSFAEKLCTVSWLRSGASVDLSRRLSLDRFKLSLFLLFSRLSRLFLTIFSLCLFAWRCFIHKLMTFRRLQNLRFLVVWLLHWHYFAGLDSLLESVSAVRKPYLCLGWSREAVSLWLYDLSLLIWGQGLGLYWLVLGGLLFLDLDSFSRVVHPRFITFLKEVLLFNFRVGHLFTVWWWLARI